MKLMIDFGIIMLIEIDIVIDIVLVIVIVIVINLITIFVIRFQYKHIIKMEELLKEFEDNGIEVKVGWKEKERKKL